MSISKGQQLLFDALKDNYPEFDWIMEHRFHTVRRWRFDIAVVEHKVAIEVQGFGYGHNLRPANIEKDFEKFNTATSMGWRLFFCLHQTALRGSGPLAYLLTSDIKTLLGENDE